MDKILINNMKIYGYHGVMEEEKILGQNFFIDLELNCDLRKAGKTDDLKDTVNYAEIYSKVENIVKNRKYNLLEKLAQEIADEILKNIIISGVKVRIRKPSAPVNGNFDFVGVEISR